MVFRATEKKKRIFSNIITWQQFSDYINNERAVAGLQVIKPNRENFVFYTEIINRLGVEKIVMKKPMFMSCGITEVVLFLQKHL